MKRAAVLGLSLCLVVALFPFNVFATSGMGASTWKTGSNSIDSVNVVVDVIEARAEQISGSGSSIVWEKDFLVTVQVYNTQSTAVFINNLGFNLQFPSGAQVGVVSLDNFGTDLFISTDGNYMFSLVPSNDFAFGSGVVVPPNSSLWAVGTVRAQNVSDSNSNFNLSSVIVRTFTTARGSAYTFGTPVDWSPLITSLDSYFSQEHLDNNNILTLLGTIKVDSAAAVSSLNNIVQDLVFSGTHFNFYPSSTINYSNSTLVNSDGITVGLVRRVGASFLIDSNVISDSHTDVDYSEYSYRVPVVLSVTITNNNSSSVRTNRFLSLNNIFPNISAYNFTIDYFYSDLFDSFTPGQSIELRYRNRDFTYGYIAPRSRNYTILYGHIDLPDSVSVAWPDTANITTNSTFTSGYDYYAPRDEFSILRDLYIGLVNPDSNSVNNPSDLNTDSQSVAGQVETIHNQEMQYFQQNQQAIESVGLSNFRFNQNYVNAFSMITSQFSSLWNALSDYSLIYIFTLLLSLATYIIRHEPTTKVKQWRSSVQAERAERISYYGNMNAVRRAGSKSSAEMRAAVRRLNKK